MVTTIDSMVRPDVDQYDPIYQFWLLTNTDRGTVPLFRDIGRDPRMVDKPANVIETMIHAFYQEQCNKYIPRIRILSVNYSAQDTQIKTITRLEVI